MESTQVKQSVSRSSIYKAWMSSKKYVFDTSVFIQLQSFLEDFGYEIIDLPHSRLLRGYSSTLNVIADAINLKKSYVTESVIKEVLAAEEKGKLWKGTSRFIKEYFGIIDNKNSVANGENPKELLNKSGDTKQYEERQYKLVWDSMKLVGGNVDVFLLTVDDELSELCEANEIVAVNMWHLASHVGVFV